MRHAKWTDDEDQSRPADVSVPLRDGNAMPGWTYRAEEPTTEPDTTLRWSTISFAKGRCRRRLAKRHSLAERSSTRTPALQTSRQPSTCALKAVRVERDWCVWRQILSTRKGEVQ
jgi:hypothetical protein